MAERNFYVLTTTVDIAESVERLVFHGPYADGYLMETEIEDEALAKDANILERLVVVDNEILRLTEPFRPGQDDPSAFIKGIPENPGLYFLVLMGQKKPIVAIIETPKTILFYGSDDRIDERFIIGYKSIPVPSYP